MVAKQNLHTDGKNTTNRPKTLNFSQTDGPLLSIGLIFRDDIQYIEKCLKALEPLRAAIPCELVMADTGSEDGSRTIAEQYADKLINFTWIGDFAAARNAVLAQCEGQWCLTIDTDEYLDPNIEALVNFLRSSDASQYDPIFVTVRNYHSTEMIEGDCTDFYSLRLFKRGRKYSGSIHESPERFANDQDSALLSVVFHHDGYAKEIIKKKTKRNLPLLEKELENHPNDLRRVVQCLESSYTREQAYKYSRMAVKLAQEQPDSLNNYGASGFREAIRAAQNRNFPEFTEWVKLARDLCPNMPVIQIDVPYMCAIHYLNADNPERCLKELELYWDGLERFETGKFAWKDLRWDTINSSGITAKNSARLTKVCAYAKLKKWSLALEALSELQLVKNQNLSMMGAFLVRLSEIWEKSNLDTVPLLLREWTALEQDDSKLADERKKNFLSAGRSLLDATPDDQENLAKKRNPADLFRALGKECPLGRSALLLSTNDVREAGELLNGIKKWEYIPSCALVHTLELGAVLPESFYRMPTEIMEQHAAGLVNLQKERVVQTVREWVQSVDEATPGQVMWLYDLTLAAVLGQDWKANDSKSLCETFREVTLAYLQTFCNPTILNEEWLNLLPQTLRFGWYYLNAQDALENGDPTTYIRQLRKGLKTAPSMKEFVKFLMEQVKAETEESKRVSDELKSLAEKVRLILSAYASDDPAVAALKASPLYRQVAHLIEDEMFITGNTDTCS